VAGDGGRGRWPEMWRSKDEEQDEEGNNQFRFECGVCVVTD
jgi:hypothetical protein